MDETDLANREKSEKEASNRTDDWGTVDIFRIFFRIKIHGKSISSASLDIEFNALKEQIFLMKGNELERREISDKKRSNYILYCAIGDIFRNFVLIKMHWKRIVNAWLNAEFNGPQGSVIR